MTHAYTPGLRLAEKLQIRKSRNLPLPGNVIVKKGDTPILAVPVYDVKKNLRTIRFLSSKKRLSDFTSMFEELKRDAQSIGKWPTNQN